MTKHYTGVGSRSTPDHILEYFSDLARYLDQQGWTLRSGAADGADAAFEAGSTRKEIYLPWKGFNQHGTGTVITGSRLSSAIAIAKEIHPCWYRLKDAPKKLHARNVFQVLGPDLKSPSKFLVCWTEGGVPVGGTRTAIMLAYENRIPVFNFGSAESDKVYSEMQNLIASFVNL